MRIGMRWLVFVISVGLIVSVAGVAFAGNSGGFRGPLNNGVYPATGLMKKWPEDGPKLLWKYTKLGDGWSAATVVDDEVYISGGAPTGYLYKFSLDGKLIYRVKYGAEFTSRFQGARSTPTVKDGHVVIASGKKDERSIYCFQAEDGKLVWHVDGNKRYGGHSQGWGYNETPLVVRGKVIFSPRSKDDKCPPVVALDLKTGETVWTADVGWGDLSAGDNSPIWIHDEHKDLTVHNLWRGVLALDPNTGKEIWKTKIKSGTIVTPCYSDGYLVIALGGGGRMACLKLSKDGKSYEHLWGKFEEREVEKRGKKQKQRVWTGIDVNGIAQITIVDGKIFGFTQMEQEVTDEKGRKRTQRVGAYGCWDVKTGKLLQTTPVKFSGTGACRRPTAWSTSLKAGREAGRPRTTANSKPRPGSRSSSRPTKASKWSAASRLSRAPRKRICMSRWLRAACSCGMAACWRCTTSRRAATHRKRLRAVRPIALDQRVNSFL